MADNIVFLKGNKLRNLSEIIYRREAEYIDKMNFQSPDDAEIYLHTCLSNYNTINSLLDDGVALANNYKNDSNRGPIAAHVLAYIESCINSALQIVRNYTLRKGYLTKISAHVQSFIKSVQELDSSTAANATVVATLTNQVQQYTEAVVEYTKIYGIISSREFSQSLKDSGIDFNTLLEGNHKQNLKFAGPFEDLKDEEKLLVYDSIIEASGRGKVLNKEALMAIDLPENYGPYIDSKDDQNPQANELGAKPEASGEGKLLDYASDIASALLEIMDKGKIILLYNAAMVTWDIYSSEHKLKTVTHEAIKQLADKGGSLLEDVVKAAIVIEIEGIEASSLFLTAVGLVVGYAGSFIIATIVEELVDWIFFSGGKEKDIPSITQGLIFYAAPMPDGKELALLTSQQHD